MASGLSDKAIAVFAFAAYHELTSGEAVTQVALSDGSGHKADPEAVKEVEAAGLGTAADDRISFTDAGLQRLAAVIEALRGVAVR